MLLQEQRSWLLAHRVCEIQRYPAQYPAPVLG